MGEGKERQQVKLITRYNQGKKCHLKRRRGLSIAHTSVLLASTIETPYCRYRWRTFPTDLNQTAEDKNG